MNVYTNHSGTTKESFSIGKRGVHLIRGFGSPTEHVDGPPGSLYLQTDLGLVYVRDIEGNWQALATQNSVNMSIMLLGKTIENCVAMCLVTVVILALLVSGLFIALRYF